MVFNLYFGMIFVIGLLLLFFLIVWLFIALFTDDRDEYSSAQGGVRVITVLLLLLPFWPLILSLILLCIPPFIGVVIFTPKETYMKYKRNIFSTIGWWAC